MLVFNATDVTSPRMPGQNPPYGFTIWLNDNGVDTFDGRVEPSYPSCGTTDIFSGLGKGGQFMAILQEHQMSIVKSALDRFARYKDLNRFITILSSGQSRMLQLDCSMPSDRPIRCCSATNSLRLSLSVSNCGFLRC